MKRRSAVKAIVFASASGASLLSFANQSTENNRKNVE